MKRVLVLGKKKDYLDFVEKNKDKGFKFDNLNPDQGYFDVGNLKDKGSIETYAKYGLWDYFISLVNDSYTREEKIAFNEIGLEPECLIKEYVIKEKLWELYEKEYDKLESPFSL